MTVLMFKSWFWDAKRAGSRWHRPLWIQI